MHKNEDEKCISIFSYNLIQKILFVIVKYNRQYYLGAI